VRSANALLGIGAAAALLLPGAAVASTGTAEVRVLHASPDAPGVDILVNGQKAISDLRFPNSTGYTSLPVGATRVQVNVAGKEAAAIAPVTLDLPAFGRFTVAAVGLVAGAGQSTQPTLALQVYRDDGTAPAAGNAKLRVIHASPDAPAVDVLAGEQKLVSNLAFRNASDFVQVPAGKYSVRVNVADTATTAIGPLELDLVAGRIYTVYAYGLLSDRTLTAGVLVDRAWDAQARVLHASPNAPGVDIYLDGSLAVPNLTFPNATSFVPFPSGRACVFVSPTGSRDVAIGPLTLELQGATKTTIAAIGLLGGAVPLTAKTYSDDTPPPAASKAKLRVLHASPDAPAVDILAGDQKIIANLAFPNASEFLEVGAGRYSVRVNVAGTTTTAIGPLDLTLEEGSIYTVYAHGLLENRSLTVGVLTDKP
jgi:hypothetical protein